MQTLLGRAYFLNGEHEIAIINSQKAKDLLPAIEDEVEKKELGNTIEVLIRKIELEMTNSTRIGNINEAAYLSSSKREA